MTEMIATLLAGVGLFFTGAKMLGSNIKLMTSRSLRMFIARVTEKGWQTAFWGTLTGLIGDSSAIAFVFVGLVESGMISIRKALPFILWNNAGAAPIMLLFVVDIRIAVLFILGTAGLFYYFQKPSSSWHGTGALFGLGLLFFGLGLLRQAVEPIHGSHVLHEIIHAAAGSYMFAFLIGAVLTIIAQSSTVVSLIAIALTKADILEVNDTIMLIYGTNVGSSLITWFLSSGIKGTGKQLVMYQVIFNFVGAIFLIPLFYLEVHSHVPSIKWLVGQLASSVEQQMALVYVLFQIVPAIVMFIFMNQFHNFLTRTWPITEEEHLSKLKYIHDHALSDPQTAMDLAEREQLHLMKFLPQYLESAMSKMESGKESISIQTLHTAFQSISDELKSFGNELVNADLDVSTSERLMNLRNQHEIIVSIEESIYQFVSSMRENGTPDELKELMNSLLNSMHAITLTAVDTMETLSESDVNTLMAITGERGSLMQSIRSSYLIGNDSLDYESKSALLNVTNLFERIVWLLARLARLLSEASKFQLVKKMA
jgi:phosphate:Na+ symporter